MGVYGQKWVLPDSKIDCISKMNDGIMRFFSCLYDFGKAKSWFNNFLVDLVKNGYDFLVIQALKSAVSSGWIYELSWLFECK